MANNNTTPLNGTIGTRQFADYNATAISRSISRDTYRSAVISDKRMQRFREIVYKMVSAWAREDKFAMLSAYGDVRSVGSNPSDEALNRALTESIIINLKPEDLEQLYRDVTVKERKMVGDIKKLNNRGTPKYSNSLTTKNFESHYEELKNAENTKAFNRIRKTVDPGFRVPKVIRQQYKKLRVELMDVLSTCFNHLEITNLAISMGIEIKERMPEETLKTWIINKTCLYVELLTGKNKKISSLSGAFMNTEPYDELLQYTSYSYITGKPGLDPNEWAEKKKAVREAKRAVEERARTQKERLKSSSKYFGEVAGIRGSSRSLERYLNKNDSGLLADADFNDLITLAGRYGISPSLLKRNKPGKIKLEIYKAMAAENKRMGILYNKAETGKTFSKKRYNYDLLSAHSDSLVMSAGETTPLEKSSSAPDMVRFNKRGQLLDKSILTAMPVYIVGQGGVGAQTKDPINGIPGSATNYKNVVTESDLSDKEINIINYIKSLPESINNGKLSSQPKSLNQLETMLVEKGCKPELFAQARKINKYVYVLIWAYAKVKRMDNLADFIAREYNIPFLKTGGETKRFFSKINPLKGLIGADVKKRKLEKLNASNPMSVSDLLENDREFYNNLNGLKIEALISEGFKYYPKLGDFVQATNSDYSLQRYGIIALIAKAKGITPVYRLCMNLAPGLKDIDAFRAALKTRRVSNAFKRIFSKPGRMIKSLLGGGTEMELSETPRQDDFNPIENAGQRLAIPKVVWNNSDNKIEGSILEVVPVFVVNKDILQREIHITGDNNLNNNYSPNAVFNGSITTTNNKSISSNDGTPPLFDVRVINRVFDDSKLLQAIDIFKDSVENKFNSLFFGLGTGFVGPMPLVSPTFLAQAALGNVRSLADTAADELQSKIQELVDRSNRYQEKYLLLDRGLNSFSTGGVIKPVKSTATSSITSIITGDASGNNIFSKGAKPELVQSTGEIKVTPLNKQSNTQTRQKITRMSSAERNAALATGISSHIVKYSYKLTDGASEISNAGEAIKVFNVKPGITDPINIGGSETTVAELLSGIYAQLVAISGNSLTSNQLLTTIAATSGTSGSSSNEVSNPFVEGFPSTIDNILGGE